MDMTFEYQDHHYRLLFHHEHNVWCTEINKTVRAKTVCYIEIQRTTGWEALVSGISYCSRSDNFAKETGRKLALKRALTAACTNRLFRTAAWNFYFNRKAKR